MFQFFKEVTGFRLVVAQLVSQYVSLRYRRTVLGFLWTMINPLFTMIITTIIFSMMMRVPIKSFAIFLFTGLIPWNLFSSCVLQGGGAILENEALVKKIYIPKQVFVISRCLSIFVDAALSFGVLFVLAIAIGSKMSPVLVFLPVAFFLTFVFSVGLSLVMSILSVFYRDAQYIVGIVLQAGYYLTPIIYPLSMVPEAYRSVFLWNPMYYFVELFRAPIYEGVLPGLDVVVVTFVMAVLSFVFGVFVFRKYDRTLIFRL